MFNSKRKRKAGVLTEVYFAILMISAALMLINVLFGNNIRDMINHSSFKQAIEKGTKRKTTFEMTNKESVRYNITSPEVQMAGYEAVLGSYNKKAKKNIEKYYENSQTTPLTDAEVKDLAKWLAIFANSAPKGSTHTGKELIYFTNFETAPLYNYYKFATSQGINLQSIDSGMVYQSSTNTLYDWSQNNVNVRNGTDTDGEARDRVSNIRDENGIIYTFDRTQ